MLDVHVICRLVKILFLNAHIMSLFLYHLMLFIIFKRGTHE